MAQCQYGDVIEFCTWTDKYVRPVFSSIDESALAMTVKNSIWIIPWAGAFHLMALGVIGGAVLLSDLRLFGLGVTQRSPAEVDRAMAPWKLGALIVLIISGSLLALGEMMRLFMSPPYWVKMGAMFSAIIFTFGARRALIDEDVELGMVGKVLAGIAVALFVGTWFIRAGGSLAWSAMIIMLAILGALVFIVGKRTEAGPTTARLAAAFSIMAWLTTAVSGRWIAFW